jgi:hypothetical protein
LHATSFSVEGIGGDATAAGGVYALFDNEGIIRYVGQTADFELR